MNKHPTPPLFSYRCDEGFSGADCQPATQLSSSVLSDFESQDTTLSTWQEVIGGEVVTPDEGCGVVSSGSSLYFSKVQPLSFRRWGFLEATCFYKCPNRVYFELDNQVC